MLRTGMQRRRRVAQVAYGSMDLKEAVSAEGVLVESKYETPNLANESSLTSQRACREQARAPTEQQH